MRATEGAPGLRIVADDLTGAGECAGVLLDAGIPVDVLLRPDLPPRPGAVAALDLDLRRHPHLLTPGVGASDFVKLDSLLRGPVRQVVDALRDARRHPVFCTAVPALRRTVVGGVTLLGGVPLHLTSAWAVEHEPAPAHVTDLLGASAASIPLAVVRGPDRELTKAIRGIVESGCVPTPDAETDADLDAIVAACGATGIPLVGSAGLFAAWTRTLPTPVGPLPPAPPPTEAGAVLIVVGSASDGARAQVAALPPGTADIHELRADQLLAGEGHRLRPRAHANVVLHIAGETHAQPAELSRALGRLAARYAVEAGCDLVLLGGETARNTLDALGVERLAAVRAIEHGALLCATADGRRVVTRPGSFGDPDALVRILAALDA